MILTLPGIIDILKNRPNANVLDKARASSKKLMAHITGYNNDNLLEVLTGLENEQQLALRKKYARSNKDIFARIHRPEDKIFSAKGGSCYYNISESNKKQFLQHLSNVYNKFSVRGWVHQFALQYYHTDPMGLIFMEVGNNSTYPTYKATSKIYDYKLKGRDVEYVVFTTEEKNIFRVVDDSFDYYVRYDAENATIIPDKTYPNYFGKVPALVISDIIKPDTEYYTSPDHDIIEIADDYLRENSVKSVFKLKHGYPKAWQYQSVCQSCKGTGHFEADKCTTCNGSGFAVSKDTSEVLALPIPAEGQPTVAPEVAGYITPDIQGWSQMSTELSNLENLMFQTYWGTHQKEDTENETATGRFIDVQPVNDRLSQFSKWAESVEKFITDAVGEFYFQSSYSGSMINYGTRYLIEKPDAIWKKYEEARTKGAPMSVLDDLLVEYYESKHASNSIELTRQVKLMKIEPFVHLTIEQAKATVPNPAEYNKKLYFQEWLNQLNPNEVIIKTVPQLTQMLTEYSKLKV